MQKSRTKALNIAAATIGVCAAVGATFWVVDSAVAARAEYHISKAVAESADLTNSPRVFAGSTIYSAAFFTGELDKVSIDMLDVEVPGVGMVNASTEVEKVAVTPEQLLSGDLEGTTAELFTRDLRMDGVAIGAQLGITDLDIAHPNDVSPSGGLASEAVLTGTPQGHIDPVSVLVTLRLVGSEFRMTPIELIDAAPDLSLDDVSGAFSWRVDTRQLPLADRAMAVYLSGGSIHFQSEARNVTLTTRELSPLAAPEEDSSTS
ncbi:LmeA family phospholipid-binding protein [Corynebacterium callunae]|uniref:LmeA family phospholipid-binding protein n=1 Tax=Corynebacterium callunae TaxID=1721 RepID=UPI001FFEBEED|nr:DUF2993 domain-containing protein [Corynebacterium callunae]